MQNTDLRPQLVIAGQKGWLMDEIASYVNSGNLRDRIVFTGYVTNHNLRALYPSCAVCVYPSLYEGFGFPPLEAMSCGAPVIASEIPVLREVTNGERLGASAGRRRMA